MAEMVKLLLTSGFHEERIQCTTDLDPEIARLMEVGVEIIRIATGVAQLDSSLSMLKVRRQG